jgi:hypothetical protein
MFSHGFLATLLAAWFGATCASILLAAYVATTRARCERLARHATELAPSVRAR